MTRSLVCLLVAFLLLGGATTHAQPAGENKERSNNFAVFGVDFAPPATLKRLPEGGLLHIGRWARLDSAGRPTAMLIFEFETVNQRKLPEFAADIAKKLKGSAVPSDVLIGGEPTYAIRDAKAGHWEVLITRKDERFYMVSGRADAADQIPRKEMDALAKSVRFVPLADPVKHLALRDESFPVLNAFTIQPLDLMRPDPGPAKPGMVGISIYDHQRKGPIIDMIMQVLPADPAVDMGSVKEKLGQAYGALPALKWTVIGAPIDGEISDVFDAQTKGDVAKLSIVLVRLSPTRMGMIIFTFPKAEDEHLPALHEAAVRVARTLRPIAGR